MHRLPERTYTPHIPPSCPGIYPTCLNLTLDNATPGTHFCVHFLNITVQPANMCCGPLVTEHYDKHASFPPHIPLVAYPHVSSALQQQHIYNIITCEHVRVTQEVMLHDSYINKLAAVVRYMRDERSLCLHTMLNTHARACCNHPAMHYGVTPQGLADLVSRHIHLLDVIHMPSTKPFVTPHTYFPSHMHTHGSPIQAPQASSTSPNRQTPC